MSQSDCDNSASDKPEEWRAIEGFVGIYEVSNFGGVRSVRVVDSIGRPVRPKPLACRPNKEGYRVVILQREWIGHGLRVSRLVALAFVLNPESKPFVNHINGAKADDRAVNLEWVTPKENTRHAWRTGLIKKRRGSQCSCARLVEAQVLQIRAMAEAGASTVAIVKVFKVSQTSVRNIVTRKAWSHI